MLHRQRVHTSQAQSLQVRNSGMGLKPDDWSEDITITFRDAVVRLSSLSVRSVVRQQQQSRRWGEASTPSPISYNIWDLRKAGPRSAGICAGLKPPSLYGSLTGRDTNQKLLLVTSGREPALAAYEAEEVLQRGSLAFVSSLASSVANGVLGVAKAAAWGRQAGYRAGIRNWVAAKVSLDQDGPPRGTKDEDLPKGEPVTLFRSLRDGPRAVDQLLLAPRGSVAVASDSFGRVLLIDVVSLTVIRIWKSYRDAQFGWIMCSWPQRAPQHSHTTEDHLLQSQSHAGKRRRADAESSHGLQDSNAELDKPVSLHLVLYAPRRQALELWQMRHGSRVATSQVSSTCKLLQRAVPFGLDPDGVNHTESDATSRTSQCLILDTNTGQCTDVLVSLQQQTHQTAYTRTACV
ncbi:TPA: Rab3 GTPase-activating protein non-catalytic subunit [Trebouxia sp. C0004]